MSESLSLEDSKFVWISDIFNSECNTSFKTKSEINTYLCMAASGQRIWSSDVPGSNWWSQLGVCIWYHIGMHTLRGKMITLAWNTSINISLSILFSRLMQKLPLYAQSFKTTKCHKTVPLDQSVSSYNCDKDFRKYEMSRMTSWTTSCWYGFWYSCSPWILLAGALWEEKHPATLLAPGTQQNRSPSYQYDPIFK